MNLTPQQKRICEQVVNVFETGTISGNYGAITIFNDGPNRIRQVTYGRSQTTEYGNLHELVAMYVTAGGTYASRLQPYIDQIGTKPLVSDEVFKQLLHDAGRNDPVMHQVQDDFFDRNYFQPAMNWADDNQFTLALSALVIYDSFIHSGRVPDFLRRRFGEPVPLNGGNEKTWISQYADARGNWLATADNPALQATVYRTQCFRREIDRNNWDLALLPINAHGVNVS